MALDPSTQPSTDYSDILHWPSYTDQITTVTKIPISFSIIGKKILIKYTSSQFAHSSISSFDASNKNAASLSGCGVWLLDVDGPGEHVLQLGDPFEHFLHVVCWQLRRMGSSNSWIILFLARHSSYNCAPPKSGYFLSLSLSISHNEACRWFIFFFHFKTKKYKKTHIFANRTS